MNTDFIDTAFMDTAQQAFSGIDLGGWGVLAWIVLGFAGLYMTVRFLRRRVRRWQRKAITLALIGTYGLGIPVTLDLGEFIGTDAGATSRCDVVRATESESLSDLPARALCRLGDALPF